MRAVQDGPPRTECWIGGDRYRNGKRRKRNEERRRCEKEKEGIQAQVVITSKKLKDVPLDRAAVAMITWSIV